MLFHPRSDLLWDTWLVEHEGLFYLFCIRLPADGPPGNPELTLGAGWDAISLATSPDLLHWTEQGTVLEKDAEALWLGTGMIHRAAGTFVMNFSEERPRGRQVISFATSPDLRHWTRLPRDYDLRPDGAIYAADAAASANPLPRWDSIGVIGPAEPGDPYLGLVCADLNDPPLPGQCGVLGLVTSTDGLRWSHLPPASGPGLFPSFEVPEHVAIGGRHYVLFSTNTTAGARFVPGDPAPQGGTYYVVADDARGPYSPPPVHPLLHGHRLAGREFGAYVGRPLRTSGGELLFYHHWSAGGPDGWWGPPKLLTERRPYVLGLHYWPGCEGLKKPGSQATLTASALEPLRPAGRLPVITWAVSDDSLSATDGGGTHGARWRDNRSSPEGSGRIVETGLRIDSGRGLGLWVGYRDSPSVFAALFNSQTRQLELGSAAWIKDGASLNLHVEMTADVPVTAGVTHRVRLLARHRFAELYLDDQLAASFACREDLDVTHTGFLADRASGEFTAPRRWVLDAG
ncbi:MAG TPA: hypothetical protein VGG25_06540 [Streptosporangiaceae bacterium]